MAHVVTVQQIGADAALMQGPPAPRRRWIYPTPKGRWKPQHHAAMAVMLFPLLLGHRVGMPDDVFVMLGHIFASQQVAGVPVREMFTDQLVQLQLEGAVL